jgi:uncharacterized protein (DUF1697 family)
MSLLYFICMTSYVALLRGISPSNPNMHNDKLRQFFEDLGFSHVRTLISSGNVLFEADSSNSELLQAKIESALPQRLGFSSTAILRSQKELQKLVDSKPFQQTEHTKTTNLNVTFLKIKTHIPLYFPHQPPQKSYTILSNSGREVCSIIDLSGSKTPDLMIWLEKQFGKTITTRTYKTVQRILIKMSEESQ